VTRASRALYWLAPIAFCIAIYWVGLRIWFWQDDFAWLNLRNHVTGFRSFLWALFAPLAQGTIRPLSERGFFMVFSHFFGLRALPYRLFVFLNQFVNIALMMLVTRKLTKSSLAGFVAPFLWIANAALAIPMAWTSAYNEIQCAMFLLLSLYWFIRYTETGERKFYWAQWVTFVLGFGALEITVVYPAIAAFYAILFARHYLRATLPMFAVSAVYGVAHRMISATKNDFYYDLNYQAGSLLQTLWQYWKILLGPSAYVESRHWPDTLAYAAVALFTAAILSLVLWQAWKKQFLPVFLLGWFLIVLAPLLPLHNHVSDYYLFIPSIGIAMLAAYGVSLAWQRGWPVAASAAVVAILYLVPAATLRHKALAAYFDRADQGRAVVQSVAYAKRIHPGKTILLKDVDDTVFWSVIYDSPFAIFGWHDVFVTPDSRPSVHEDPHFGPIDQYFLPAAAVASALHNGTAVVYTIQNRTLRNITSLYTMFIDSQPAPGLAAAIDMGSPYFKDQVGEGWYDIENNFRWSGKHAVVYLIGPTATGRTLTVHGYATPQEIAPGPLHFALTVDGRPEPVKIIDQSNLEFRFEYDLPADLVGRPRIEVAFTLDRTIRVPGDRRDLGVILKDFSIR
jgi:hypothetical protein